MKKIFVLVLALAALVQGALASPGDAWLSLPYEDKRMFLQAMNLGWTCSMKASLKDGIVMAGTDNFTLFKTMAGVLVDDEAELIITMDRVAMAAPDLSIVEQLFVALEVLGLKLGAPKTFVTAMY